MRVLVVEDEQKIAQFLKKGLTEKGYAVETAADADTALERGRRPADDQRGRRPRCELPARTAA